MAQKTALNKVNSTGICMLTEDSLLAAQYEAGPNKPPNKAETFSLPLNQR